MFQLIFKNTNNFTRLFQAQSQNILSIVKRSYFLNNDNVRFNFAAKKKKKVIELKQSTINFSQASPQLKDDVSINKQKSFFELRQKVQSLPWQQMRFDQLCSLDQQIIQVLQTQLKKDKFNISDDEFMKSQIKKGRMIPLGSYDQLDRNYKRAYSLLRNTNQYYEEFPPTQHIQKGYLHEIYVTDLKNDLQLIKNIARFIKHISRPEKLEAITEPTFIKYLLSLKRQLMLQGIHFQTKAEKKQSIQKGQTIIESKQKQQLPKIKILEILEYQYEFWQDVKHNRAKNGNQQNFFIETKQVPNPNQTILLKQFYPTVKIKYIARKKSLNDSERCFCLKAHLLIQVNEKFKRKIKVEWKGPTNKKSGIDKSIQKKSTSSLLPEHNEQIPWVNYMVIDYENIYDGNPTIRPIFYF